MLAQRPLLTIVSNADERFFPGLAVAVASATAAASGGFDYQFLILDGGLAADSLDELARTIGEIGKRRGIRATLQPLAIDQARLIALPERRGSRMHYAKLVLPEILGHLDSIIYVDADVLCFRGLEAALPPAGDDQWLLVGARDYFSVLEKDCPWLDQVPPAERRLPYINSGLMGMNLKAMREMKFTERAITARVSAGEARFADQSVFNFLCRGKSYILPDAINHRTEIGSSRQFCQGNLDLNIHYIGAPKPWLGSPKTSNWLAHRLWHQACAALFPGKRVEPPSPLPRDRGSIRRKAVLYALINPSRAAHYRSDLRSLRDPANILALASHHWSVCTP